LTAVLDLPVGCYRLNFEPSGPLRLPTYAGSAWRGAFGHALRRAVCVTRLPVCTECLLVGSCTYAYIFETPPPPQTEKMRRYAAAPHPFVLELPGPEDLGEGRPYPLGLTLFGHGNRHLPYLLHALQRTGEEGIGHRRTPCHLQEVWQHAGLLDAGECVYRPGGALRVDPPKVPALPDMPRQVRLDFSTPLRIQRDGQNVGPGEFQFADLFGSLLRRISMLTYFHTDTPLETDFAGLMAAARAVISSRAELRWYDWTRYSSRQGTTMEMGGLLGSVELDMAGMEPFWPYLWLGQWTHAGKGTSMGLGRYVVAGLASLRSRHGPPVSAIIEPDPA
jgi:hypothetical protein